MKYYILLLISVFFIISCEKKETAKKDQNIIFDNPPNLLVGDEVLLKAESTSGLPIKFESSDPSFASVEGNKLKALKKGSVFIIASQKGNNEYYEAINVRRLLTIEPFDINKKTQEISFSFDIEEWRLSQGPLLLKDFAKSNSNSGIPIVFYSGRESAATVDKNGYLNIAYGAERQSVTIYAYQPGNSEYNVSKSVAASIIVVCDQH